MVKNNKNILFSLEMALIDTPFGTFGMFLKIGSAIFFLLKFYHSYTVIYLLNNVSHK